MKIRNYMKEFSSKYTVRIITIAIVAFLIVTGILLIKANLNAREDEQYKKILEKYIEEKGTLIYGADDSAPPLRFVDDDGVYKGVVVDMVNQLSLEMGIEIRCVPFKWEDALRSLKEGRTDMCDMFMSEERSKSYVFSDPLYNLRTVMVISIGDEYSLDDINHIKIATQKGDYANEYLNEHYPDAELVYVHDVGEALNELMEDKVDAVIGDEPVLLYYADKKDIEDKLSFLGTSLYELPCVLALPKSEEDLLPVINHAIEAVKSTDAIEKIQQKWFTISAPITMREENTLALRIFLFGFIAVFLVALFFYLNSLRLRHMVDDRTRELNGKNQELQFIFDSMAEGIILLDSKGEVINGNSGFFESEKSDAGDTIRCSDYLKKYCSYEGCMGMPDKCSEGCIVHDCLKEDREITVKRQTGARFYEIKAAPTSITDITGDEKAVLVVVRDITLDEINDKKLLQNSKMAAVGQLAAGMAHQIKNPLGVIRTQSYLLRRGKGEDEYVTNSLDYIDDSVKRAASIIDNVMNFWRMSDDTIEEVKVKEFFESLKALNEGSFKRKKASLNISVKDDLVIRSYPESLKHIFHNLISNGLDALDEGGRVDITADDYPEGIIVKVKDNGCGIDEENLKNLYNPFFTTKEPGEGTGLGMFVIYSEVEKIGGTVEVSSEVGKGTEFRVMIPKEREEQ